mgnify:FL=1
MNLQVLLIEDDPHMRLGCQQALALADMTVLTTDNAEAAQTLGRAGFQGVVVSDVRLPGMDGMAFLRWAGEHCPGSPVILITGHGDVTLAVEAMRAGAYDFIQKPFAAEHLVEVVHRALDKCALMQEVHLLRQQLQARHASAADMLIGHSPKMEQLRRTIAEVADVAVDVLIQGETGTGKEVVARCLHDLSSRKGANFVALNCGGMPDNLLDSELFGHEAGAFTGAQKRRIGKIEYASGGTLFLDELETMPLAMQIKLLRVLQERTLERLGSNQQQPVNCRVVAATKEDLRALSDQRQFRADLYYRLNVVRLELPALRERLEDIPLLLQHFVLLAASRYHKAVPDVPPAVLRQCMAHNWPGNVRELRNAADCLVLGLPLSLGNAHFAGSTSLVEAVDGFERALIADALQRCNGSLSKAAEALKVAKSTLHDKIRKHGLSV